MKRKLVLLILAIGFFGACGTSESTISLQVKSPGSGDVRNTFQVEVADDPSERSMGLMFRKKLGGNEGMLFIFSQDTTGSFWMQNTLIPLDIIFIDVEKKIINIVGSAEPQTTTPRSPEGPYRYVLEIPGGRAAALGIVPGDRVEFNL